MAEFITKDSGERAQFESGMQRDTQAGKPRFELMLPLDIPYEEQMIVRLAALYGRGAEKYDERNWEQANSRAEMDRMKASAFRHFMQWMCGETDEDHAAGAMFNIIAFETTAFKVDGVEDWADKVADEILATPSPKPAETLDISQDLSYRTKGPQGPNEVVGGDACHESTLWEECVAPDCRAANHKNAR